VNAQRSVHGLQDRVKITQTDTVYVFNKTSDRRDTSYCKRDNTDNITGTIQRNVV